MTKTPTILVLGTADWEQPIATNQHYMVRELAGTNWSITFVESLALRKPTFSLRDLRRIASRLKKAVSQRPRDDESWRPRPKGLSVVSPIVFPRHRGVARLINRVLIKRAVRDWRSSSAPRVLWCYTPTTYGLENYADVVVYHCVDLLHTVPGIDPRVITAGETRLATIGATAIASSEAVARSLRIRGFDSVHLWENVADTAVFESALTTGAERQPGRAIFAGNLSPAKIDYSLLVRLAESGVDVRLAGPRAEGGGVDDAQFNKLVQAGVTYLGMLSLEELAAEMVVASVGLIPYVINDYTRGVSPLKTYEYLAAGLPLVATALPGVHEDGVDIMVASGPDQFLSTVNRLVRDGFDDEVVMRRIAKATANSWSGRGRAARQLVSSLLSEAGRDSR